MRRVLSILLFVSLLFLASVHARSASGTRVLVLLDDVTETNKYSRLWQSLKERDFDLDFKTATDENIELGGLSSWHYDHVIHFAPKASEFGKYKKQSALTLVTFVKDGGNLLVAANGDATEFVTDLASQFSIELGSLSVYKHDALDKSHSVISTNAVVAPSTIVPQLGSPIVYKGVGLSCQSNPLLSTVLTAGEGAFSSRVYKSESSQSTQPIDLVCAMQARNSARAVFTGSLDMFSDEFVDKVIPGSGESSNEEFTTELFKWTFQEKSVLKLVDHRHHREGETTKPAWYRIKDPMVYILEVAEFNGDHWIPFKADDIQLEVIMLDPYIRTTLKQTDAPGHHFGRYEARLRLPDVYGVFTFRVNYKRPGLTYLRADDVLPLRPFRHNEYQRFLLAAYPYYASVASMIVGFIIFSTIWLLTWGSRDKNAKTKKKTQ